MPACKWVAVGLTSLQIFLERGEREQWFESSFIVTTALVALVTLAVLVMWELYTDEPVINFRLFKLASPCSAVFLSWRFFSNACKAFR